jgi:hypothetical protein
MKKAMILVLMLFVALPAMAAVVSWTAPTTYSDATPIPSADISRITYQIYYGSAQTGPWTAGVLTGPGTLTGTAPDPAVGTTRWYTVSAILDGQEGAKGVAASKNIPFKVPAAPLSITVQ